MVAARWRVEAALADVKGAKAQFYPNINLGAFVGVNALGLNRLFNAGSLQMGVAPALRLPLLTAGCCVPGCKAARPPPMWPWPDLALLCSTRCARPAMPFQPEQPAAPA